MVRTLRRAGAGLAAFVWLGCVGMTSLPPEVRRGDEALARGDHGGAAEAYRAALDAHPRNPAALHGLARAYAADGELDAALAIYSGLELGAPTYFSLARADYSATLASAARSRSTTGDVNGELRLLERLVVVDPTQREARVRLEQLRRERARAGPKPSAPPASPPTSTAR